MPYDIENSDIDINSVITITDNCTIIGSNGTEFTFLRLRQYVMCGTTTPTRVIEPCDTCPNKVKYVVYWKVCISGEEFLIPYANAVIEGNLRTVFQQDLYQNNRKRNYDQPKDYKMVAQDILGREINTGREDVANHERITQIEKLRYANDGKQYGGLSYAETDQRGREVPTDKDETETDTTMC